MTGAVAVHEALGNGDLLSPAYSLRGLTPAEVKFFTAPVMGTDIEGTANVVYLDTTTGGTDVEPPADRLAGAERRRVQQRGTPDVPR